MVYRRYVIAEMFKSAGAVFLLVAAVYSCDCAIVSLDGSQAQFDTSGLSPKPILEIRSG